MMNDCKQCREIKLETLRYFERMLAHDCDGKSVHERANVQIIVMRTLALAAKQPIPDATLDSAIERAVLFFK